MGEIVDIEPELIESVYKYLNLLGVYLQLPRVG